MKRYAMLSLMILGVRVDAASAQASHHRLSASPLLGAWAVDVSQLPVPPAARPKSVMISFSDAGGQKIGMDVRIQPMEGPEVRYNSAFDLVGTPVSVPGGIEADMVAAKSPRPDVLILALGKGGIPASTRIYTVNPGGQRMTETAVYFGDDGKPIMRTNFFSRIRIAGGSTPPAMGRKRAP